MTGFTKSKKMTLPSVLEMTSAAALNLSLKEWSKACKALISFVSLFFQILNNP
jgi:hypothetical protein